MLRQHCFHAQGFYIKSALAPARLGLLSLYTVNKNSVGTSRILTACCRDFGKVEWQHWIAVSFSFVS